MQPEVLAERAEQQGLNTDWDNVNSWPGAGDASGRAGTER